MELLAPSHWRSIDFISDLHLHESDLLTFDAWAHYLHHTTADAVIILGDLFEVWVGDDCLQLADGFVQQCVAVLRRTANQRDLYIMQGNRDFLMGSTLMSACSAQFLEDPTVLTFAQQRWLLTHGDALCLADTDYMAFRTVVRSPEWQREFLSKALAERMELARGMRAQSETRKHANIPYVDLDTDAVQASLQQLTAQHMIHGHTHRPKDHVLKGGLDRMVLSDWDLQAQPPRAEILRLSLPTNPVSGDASVQASVRIERLAPSQAIAVAMTRP